MSPCFGHFPEYLIPHIATITTDHAMNAREALCPVITPNATNAAVEDSPAHTIARNPSGFITGVMLITDHAPPRVQKQGIESDLKHGYDHNRNCVTVPNINCRIHFVIPVLIFVCGVSRSLAPSKLHVSSCTARGIVADQSCQYNRAT